MSDKQNRGEIRVDVTSLYGAREHRPFVQLEIGAAAWQFPPAKAREIGAMLVEASFASEADGFLFEFAAANAAGDEAVRLGATMLREFRKWREEREATEKGATT